VSSNFFKIGRRSTCGKLQGRKCVSQEATRGKDGGGRKIGESERKRSSGRIMSCPVTHDKGKTGGVGRVLCKRRRNRKGTMPIDDSTGLLNSRYSTTENE